MKQENSIREQLIVRYLLGQASGKEMDLLKAWLEADEKNRSLFTEFQNIWNMDQVHRELTPAVEKKDWEKLRLRMQSAQKPVVPIDTRHPGYMKRWLQVAAVFLVGFAISWFVFNVFSPDHNVAGVYNEIITPLGSNSTVMLPDGTEIVLNAGSKLRYPQAFKKQRREVFLEGEAFFIVKADPNRKFLVNTPDITIKVYGTRFNVKAYSSDKTVETTLVEGKISVIPKSIPGKTKIKEIVLYPNQRLVLNKMVESEKSMQKEDRSGDEVKNTLQVPKLIISKRVDPKYYTSWKDGRLIIKSERLDNLAVKLERRYNVRIHFKDEEVKKYRFTGIIEDETVEQVFDAIKTASKINYKIQDRDIWIGN